MGRTPGRNATNIVSLRASRGEASGPRGSANRRDSTQIRIETGNKRRCSSPFIPRGSATEDRDHGCGHARKQGWPYGNVDISHCCRSQMWSSRIHSHRLLQELPVACYSLNRGSPGRVRRAFYWPPRPCSLSARFGKSCQNAQAHFDDFPLKTGRDLAEGTAFGSRVPRGGQWAGFEGRGCLLFGVDTACKRYCASAYSERQRS